MTIFSESVKRSRENVSAIAKHEEQRQNLEKRNLNKLFSRQRLREAFFDRITHDDAIEIFERNVGTSAFRGSKLCYDYNGCPVVTLDGVDKFYGVETGLANRLYRFVEEELIGDGFLIFRGSQLDNLSTIVDQLDCSEGHQMLLLPPRALLKMAFFVPGSATAQTVLKRLFQKFGPAWTGQDERVRGEIINGTRIYSHTVAKYRAIAQKQSKLPFIHHFGTGVAKESWIRLLNYEGAFPPPSSVGYVKLAEGK